MKESLSSVILASITAEPLVSESKLFSLGISGTFEFCGDSGSELEQFRWVSIDSDVGTCEALGSDSDIESSEQEESLKRRYSEHAVLLVCSWPVRQNSVVQKKMSQGLMQFLLFSRESIL